MIYRTPITCRVSVCDNSSNSKASMGSLINKILATILPADRLYMKEVYTKGPASEIHRWHLGPAIP